MSISSFDIFTQPGLYRHVLILQNVISRAGILKLGAVAPREHLLRDILLTSAEDLCKLPALTLAGYVGFLESILVEHGIEYPKLALSSRLMS